MPIMGEEIDKNLTSPEYLRYEAILKQIIIQDNLLTESKKAWKKSFQERFSKYTSILAKLDKIDSNLYKKQHRESLNKDYKYVVDLWRLFVEDSFTNISGAAIERNLPELVTYDKFSVESGIPENKISTIEKKYADLKKHYNDYSNDFDISLEKDTLYYNKILLASGKLRSKIYQRLSLMRDESIYEFTNENLADLWREIRIIPLRWTATFYSKILEFRDHLQAGPVGYMVVVRELVIFGILLLFLISFIWFFNRLTDNFEEIAESYLRKAYRSNDHWFLQYILSLANKSIPLLVLQLGLWFIEGILEKTTISELAEFVPYINYYIIYRLSLIITSYTITRFKAHHLIIIDYNIHAKILRSLTSIFKFILINMMILHTIDTIVGEAMVYGICYQAFVFVGLIYSIYLIDNWRVSIFQYLVRNFKTKNQALLKPHFHYFYAPLVSFCVFIIIILDKSLNLAKSWLDRFDFSKKLSAKMFLAQIRNVTAHEEHINHDLPDSYVKVFEKKDHRTDSIITPKEFIDCRLVIEKWLEGDIRSHSMMIYGSYGSGKTTLLSSLEHNVNQVDYQYVRLHSKILTSNSLLNELKKILGGKSNDIDTLILEWSKRKQKIIICIDDAHNLFLSNPGGSEAVKALIYIINRNIPDIFWVATFHQYAWDYISKVLECSQCFDEIIKLESWSSENIEDLIMSKHKRTNFELSYDDIFFALEKKHLKETIDYMKSKFFKLLWEQSDGNPSRSISIWLSSLRYGGYKTLHISLPPEVNISNLSSDIGNNLLFVCASILRHEFLSFEQIQKTTNQTEDTILYILKLAQKKNIIIQDEDLNYRLNPEYSGNIIKTLKRKNYAY